MAGPAKHRPVNKNSGIHNTACQWEIAPSSEATSRMARTAEQSLGCTPQHLTGYDVIDLQGRGQENIGVRP